jgi:hypothetical protein
MHFYFEVPIADTATSKANFLCSHLISERLKEAGIMSASRSDPIFVAGASPSPSTDYALMETQSETDDVDEDDSDMDYTPALLGGQDEDEEDDDYVQDEDEDEEDEYFAVDHGEAFFR